ncbi:nucleotidyltransferase family protein [Mammaliicoccus sciuri]|uniref:nucleotidyltransferase family protein n=1 Tax=Mammaliicoccus sciuri TaxID=1296 RepID=UPI0034DD4ED9
MEKKRRTFSPEFKLQMVQLFKNGKSRKDIIQEYTLTPSALDKWIKDYDKTGSFKHQDNLSEDEKELKKLFNCGLNWIYIIGQIDFHKISGLVWKNIKKLILSNPENSFVCSHLINTLETKYQYQGIRAKKQLTIINDIVNQFKNNNIKFALLKGIPLSIMSYQDISVRLSNDIDILVRTKDLEKVNSILKDMGFVQGEYDFYKNRIYVADNSSTILSSLVSHEVYPYTKIVNDILDYTQVDIQFSIELLTGNRTDEIVEDILNDINEIKIINYEIPSLSNRTYVNDGMYSFL